MTGRHDVRSPERGRPVVVGVAVPAALLVTGVAGWALAHQGEDRVARETAPRATSSAAAPAPATGRPARTLETRALRVLRQWDRRRSSAYAAGSAARLRRLYVSSSRAGEADVDLLRDYRRRGLRVTGMRTQVLGVSVLEHRDGRWRLRVLDRLVGAVAVGDGQRVRLPQGRADGFVLTLVADGDRWRMSSTRRARTALS